MCGITSYLGPKEAYPILLKGLERLEYRGYDSAGIAIQQHDLISVVKMPGKVSELANCVIEGTIGIAHTRWATHGKPNKVNSHPHCSSTGQFAIVHNGIIENYDSLKRMLLTKGYSFFSETDTEVLVNLIDLHYQHTGIVRDAIVAALHQVVGAFGIVVMHKEKQALYAARRGSPLVLGIKNEEYFIASDPAAFLEHTRRVLYLEDDDIVCVTAQGYDISSIHAGHEETSQREVNHIQWDLSAVEKNGHEHFMLKEILEQGQSLRNCIAGRCNIEHAIAKLSSKIGKESCKKLRRILITGCGTSLHAALVAKNLLEEYANIPVEVRSASEFRYSQIPLNSNDLLVVISQSGETADTLAALRKAKRKGVKSFGIVNTVGSSIAREVDEGMYIRAGPEIGVASTKAFTAQVLTLTIFSISFAVLRAELSKSTAQQMLDEVNTIPELIEQYLEKDSSKILEAANAMKSASSCFYLGRGIHVASALEGALKLKEISYIHAEAFPAAEMKHGPIALLEPQFPVVIIALRNDPLYEKILSSVEEVKARGAKVIVVCLEKDTEIIGRVAHTLPISERSVFTQPVLVALPLQLLAYHCARLRGCEIDQPKNLAKSVTVE